MSLTHSRHRVYRAVAIVAGIVLGIGCASARPKPVDARTEVESATHQYASLLRGAPADSVVAVYAEDGELTIPGVGTLHGRKAIHDFIAPLAANVTVASVEMQIDSLTINGAAAEERGRFRQVAGPKGGTPREYHGTFHATWRREADSRWRITRLVMQPAAAKAR